MVGKLFKRKLEDEINKFVKRREIIGIRGARQTGKTTLLKVIERRNDLLAGLVEDNEASSNLVKLSIIIGIKYKFFTIIQ